MQIPMDMNALVQSLFTYAYSTAPAGELKTKLQAMTGSTIDKVLQGIELLYAFRDQLDPSTLTLLGQLSGFGSEHGWELPGQPDRLTGIYSGVRRDLGEAGTWPAVADDPVPQVNQRTDGKDWRQVIAPDLNQLKAAKRRAVQDVRDAKTQGTCSVPLPNSATGMLQIDDTSKIKIDGKTLRAQIAKSNNDATFTVNWIMADNSIVALNADQMIAMGEAADDFVTKCYGNYVALEGKINAVQLVATDATGAPIDPATALKNAVTALDAIDITAGWPS